MAIQINQVGPGFAGEVSGIDLTQPLSPEDAAAIHAGMDEYAVLVFHGQKLTPDQQLAFTQALGPPGCTTGSAPGKEAPRPPPAQVRRRGDPQQEKKADGSRRPA